MQRGKVWKVNRSKAIVEQFECRKDKMGLSKCVSEFFDKKLGESALRARSMKGMFLFLSLFGFFEGGGVCGRCFTFPSWCTGWLAARVGVFAWENLLKGGYAILLKVHYLNLQVWYVEASAGEGYSQGYVSGMWWR